MTIKLQYSINPSKNIHHRYTEVPQVDSQKLEFSMDRILESQNLELMKKTMLMQEQVFKQQVQELHRVYSVQKKLMQQLQNVKEIAKTETGQNFQVFGARDDHNQINGHKSLETAEEDQTTNPSENGEDDVQVELTLSIGHNCTTKEQIRAKSQQMTHDGSSSSSSKKTNKGQVITSSSSSVYQESTRPHWLFQDLSLNRT